MKKKIHDPKKCPKCKLDFTGSPIPVEDREYFGMATNFSTVIGLSDWDKTIAWRCPSCGHVWERKR